MRGPHAPSLQLKVQVTDIDAYHLPIGGLGSSSRWSLHRAGWAVLPGGLAFAALLQGKPTRKWLVCVYVTNATATRAATNVQLPNISSSGAVRNGYSRAPFQRRAFPVRHGFFQLAGPAQPFRLSSFPLALLASESEAVR
ncbi:hypothetical protein V2G26_015043 [Clonostachys chloroleuca]